MQKASLLTQRVITDPAQITKEWLESCLTNAGALVSGSIDSFVLTRQPGTWSSSVDITLTYQPNATGSLPARLFLKLCQVGAEGFGASEINYYTKDYLDSPDVPLLTCYGAAYFPPDFTFSPTRPGYYHLLLENVAATHSNCWQLEPNANFARRLGEAFAALHAPYWGAPNLEKHGAVPFPQRTKEELARYFAHIRPGLEPLLAAIEGDANTDPAWLTLIPRIFEWHPKLMLARSDLTLEQEQAARRGQGFTLIHGDLNPGNILWPNDDEEKETGRLYLIDRQPFDWSLTHWLGASDLTYAIVTWWPPQQRRELEHEVLRSYHSSLLAHGITGYSWAQLIYDYKLCAIQTLYVATEWCRDEKTLTEMRWVWYPQLQRAMAAFADLDCASLVTL